MPPSHRKKGKKGGPVSKIWVRSVYWDGKEGHLVERPVDQLKANSGEGERGRGLEGGRGLERERERGLERGYVLSVREEGQPYRLQCVFVPSSQPSSSSLSLSIGLYQECTGTGFPHNERDGDDDEGSRDDDNDYDDDNETSPYESSPLALTHTPSSSLSSSLTAVVPFTVLPCATRVVWAQPPPIGNHPHLPPPPPPTPTTPTLPNLTPTYSRLYHLLP